jgi:hypothetical protein
LVIEIRIKIALVNAIRTASDQAPAVIVIFDEIASAAGGECLRRRPL